MAFFTLGLVLLLRRRITLFYALFVIGTVNRESIVLLVPAFLLLSPVRGGGARRVLFTALHCLVLLAVWWGVRAFLTGMLSGPAENVMYEEHLGDNLRFLRDMLLLKRHALRMWLTFGGLWLFVPFAWRRLPAAFRRVYAISPLMLAVMAYTGNLNGEARIWSELVPLMALPAALVLSRSPEAA